MEAIENGAVRTRTEGPAAEAADPGGLMERVQRLSAEVERIEDPAARGSAQDLLAAVMDLYGEGLVRVLAATEDAGEAGESIRRGSARTGWSRA